MSINIQLANNSLKNTTASCDSLGIHYEIEKEQGIVSVKKWDRQGNRNVPVGDIQYLIFGHDKIHMSGEDEWNRMSHFLKRSSKPFSSARTFIGNDGKEYRWTTRLDQLYMFDAHDKGAKPLVKFHRHHFQPSWIEIRGQSVMNSLDNIIVSFLVVEKKRRERGRRRRAAAASGGGGGGGG
ncbi:hypothetical protein CPB86DRAFT_788550 [Serendipita vermifera]|nr:hypothetical protein CPB86DRAFT_788550 [Serendipita vermifera]